MYCNKSKTIYNPKLTIMFLSLFFVGLQLFVKADSVEIVDYGLVPLIKGHIGIQFFVTVTNKNPDVTEVEVTKVKCCENFPDGHDCSHFNVLTETWMMDPNTTRNFTVIHPTLYPYNRKGECLLAVKHMTSCNHTREARQNIGFDTSLNADNVRSGLLIGFPKSAIDASPCHSIDEDALDGCQMVDCHVKYFGLRSFYNKGTCSCEPVPPCLSTHRHGAPDVIYDVTTNTCRNLSSPLGSGDLQHLLHTDLEPECAPFFRANPSAFVNCHHGQVCKATSDCRCQKGYVKAVTPQEPGSPRTQLFHSCNVIASCWHFDRFMVLPPWSILISSFLTSVIVAIISCCIVWE